MSSFTFSGKTFVQSSHILDRFEERVVDAGFDVSFEELIDEDYFDGARTFINNKGETMTYFTTTVSDSDGEYVFGVGYKEDKDLVTLTTFLDPKMVEDNDNNRNGIKASIIKLVD